MMGKQIMLPHRVWGQLNVAWAVFFAMLGIVNLFVAYNFTTDQWVNFKLFGATGCLFVFIVAAEPVAGQIHEGGTTMTHHLAIHERLRRRASRASSKRG